ncbi:MAG: homocysteine S-methyltransferase family protein [Minicystis sp.]
MIAQHPILSRLETGRPLLVSADGEASLRARDVPLHGPAALGLLVREHPGMVAEHYHHEIVCGVDVLCALTSDTLPRALAQIGMPFRAAALTGCAVDLALDAADDAPRPVIVAGMLGNPGVAPPAADRIAEELAMHATRLAAAGCELILARGFGRSAELGLARLSRRAAVVSAAATELPTWAVIEVDEGGFTDDGEALEDAGRAALDSGAQVVLLEIDRAAAGFALLDRLRSAVPRLLIGFAPAARPGESSEAWAGAAKQLIDAGSSVLGGGPGTTGRHLAALSRLLRGGERPSLWPSAG